MTKHQPLATGTTVVFTSSEGTFEYTVTKSGPTLTTVERQVGQYKHIKRIPTSRLRGEGWQSAAWSVR